MEASEFKLQKAEAIASILIKIAEAKIRYIENPNIENALTIRVLDSEIRLILQTPFPKFEKGSN